MQAAFGGSLHPRPSYNGGAPSMIWAVVAKRDLAAIVAYLDAHPLRAKKARDFAVWREAVLIFTAQDRNAPGLLALREALMRGRVYSAEEVAAIVDLEPPAQLELV